MNLVVDIGNSFIKSAVFKGEDIVMLKSFRISEYDLLVSGINDYPVKRAIVSSVSLSIDFISSSLKNKIKYVLFPNLNTRLPFKNLYLDKETLGFDRIAAAAGAQALFPGENIIIIDAGTAITIDVVTKEGQFIGGNISPGVDMRFKALNEFTSKLPLVKIEGETGITAKTTEDAIRFGVFNGIKYEMDGYIDAFNQIYENLKVILTGGDHKYFDKKLKNSIFADSNLTLKGLNKILQFNVS